MGNDGCTWFVLSSDDAGECDSIKGSSESGASLSWVNCKVPRSPVHRRVARAASDVYTVGTDCSGGVDMFVRQLANVLQGQFRMHHVFASESNPRAREALWRNDPGLNISNDIFDRPIPTEALDAYGAGPE